MPDCLGVGCGVIYPVHRAGHRAGVFRLMFAIAVAARATAVDERMDRKHSPTTCGKCKSRIIDIHCSPEGKGECKNQSKPLVLRQAERGAFAFALRTTID